MRNCSAKRLFQMVSFQVVSAEIPQPKKICPVADFRPNSIEIVFGLRPDICLPYTLPCACCCGGMLYMVEHNHHNLTQGMVAIKKVSIHAFAHLMFVYVLIGTHVACE